MRGKLTRILTHSIIAAALCTQTSLGVDVPTLEGSWWKIADSHPDVSPYSITSAYSSPACDFTIFEDADGTWHLVSCIRGTTYPGATRFFFEWTSPSLTATNWTEKSIFMTTGTENGADKLGRSLDEMPYTREGRLQAPHCFTEGGKWYMFHNNGGAFAFVSSDGKSWDFLQPTQPAPFPDVPYALFSMSRDVMIFDNRATDGKWYGCFLQNTSNGAVMAARTATSLRGPWSDNYITLQSGVNPESPFIVKRKNTYYLFEHMKVYAASSITGFSSNPITKLTPGDNHGYWAPEVLLVDGQYYIAGYNSSGIHVCKLHFPGDATPAGRATASAGTLDGVPMRIVGQGSERELRIAGNGPHLVRVVGVDGREATQYAGFGAQRYSLDALTVGQGMYVIDATVDGIRHAAACMVR